MTNCQFGDGTPSGANTAQFGGAIDVFLGSASVSAKPQQAKGVDSALRTLAATPLGPWLLVLVAIGLIMFGVFSCCEAKWLRL